MKTAVNAEQIAQFRDLGFLVVEGFLDEGELQLWREVTEEAMRLRLTGTTLNNQGEPDSFYAQVFTQCLNLKDIHPRMAQLVFDERLGQTAGTLAGLEGVRVWHDQALVKGPYANPTAFHFDDPFWSFYSHQAVNMWVALDDATLANGCLWYFPGTQRAARFELVGIGENLGDIFKAYPEWRKIEAVPAPCPAGSAIFHNGLIAHGAGANMTPFFRRAMTVGFMPHDAVFNGIQSILPDDYFKTLKVGDVLNNDRVNRLTWQKAD
jgi:phytanoyl-CoA hydroxylase